MGALDLFFKVIAANNEKVLSSQYLHTYLYYFHIITSDPFFEKQGQVQGLVTLTYFSRSQRLIKEKSLSSRYLHTYNMYCFHINTSDPYDETQHFILVPIGHEGTGMIASSSVRHFTEALVYNNHPRAAAAASSCLVIIFRRIASSVPWFLRSTAEQMQHPHQCMRWCRPW